MREKLLVWVLGLSAISSARALEPEPQIIDGWIDAYSAHIENTIASSYPNLLQLPSARMTRVCPQWESLDSDSRKEFWSALLWAIAGQESSRNRTLEYVESSMNTDPVTGYQVRSEGMLQLSYQDVNDYHYTGGDISWEKDKDLARADFQANLTYGNPDRTILNAYANFNMGLFIMNQALASRYPAQNFEDALGHYWSTMQTARSHFPKVMNDLMNRKPDCFK